MDKIKKKLRRLKELERFASEFKKRIRATGRSRVVNVDEFEDLIVKYNIKIK